MSTHITDRCAAALEFAQDIHNAPAVLVGGAVRDLLLEREPKDWDIYFLDSTADDLREKFKAHTNDLDTRPFLRHEDLAAELLAPFGHVQIMATPYSQADLLLDSTDWNVSAFAFDGGLIQREDPANIRAGQPLRLLTVSNPMSTLARGFEFSSRFKMLFQSRDVYSLCLAITQRPQRPPPPPRRLIRQINALRGE
jgi:hypothetical protein